MSEEHDAPASVARDGRAVAEHEPPAFAALSLGHGGQQARRLWVLEWKQRQLLASIERGGDTRRPAAEPSTAGK